MRIIIIDADGPLLQHTHYWFNTFYSWPFPHYSDVRMGAIASQITSLTIVYSSVYSDADQRKHQSSASLAFVWGILRGLMNSPHKGPVTWKMFPFDDVIMIEIIAFDPDSLRIKTWFGRKKYLVVKINPSNVGSMHYMGPEVSPYSAWGWLVWSPMISCYYEK